MQGHANADYKCEARDVIRYEGIRKRITRSSTMLNEAAIIRFNKNKTTNSKNALLVERNV
jgi:hypothetical protein